MTSELLVALNEQQYAAVTAGTGPVLVLAGPGSGKTGVLTRRVAYLIQEMNVKPWHVIAVTFTNKAAGEMRHRIQNYLGKNVPGLQIGTFHATCAKILRIEHEATNYNQDYVIFSTDDQLLAVQQAMNELGINIKKYSPRGILNRISGAKNELILPDNYVAQDYFSEAAARVYPRYQEILLDSNAMDYDDLLVQMVLLLRNNEVVREKYQQRYAYVLVDEFQDTNTAQYQLVQLVCKPQNNVFVVGDEDQSIYAFRGADYRNVRRFREDYPDAQVILMEHNYRSTQVVLDAARAVIDRNTNRTPKALFTDRKDGALIIVEESYNDEYEATYVMEQIHRLIDRAGYGFSDFAIMYRVNAQSRALETACRNHGVPYRLVGGVGFYQRREIRDLMAYVRVINNPDDKLGFARIINVPRRGIGDKSLQDFQYWCTKHELTYSAGLAKLVNGEKTSLPKRVASAFTKFGEQLQAWQAKIETVPLVELFDDVVARIGYTSYLSSISDTSEQFEERSTNVRELRGFLARYDESEATLSEFLQEQQLMTDEDRSDETGDKVTLLTLHAAKGLEFSVVFITGLEEGLLPHSRSLDDPDGMEEERRLFYVGITRAKDHLFLTHAFRRALYGGYTTDTQEKSSFLYDIPDHLIDAAASNIGQGSAERHYREATTWDRPTSGLSRLSHDLREQSEKTTDYGSDEKLRNKIIPFPGSKPGTSAPLKRFKSRQQVYHPVFGKGTVIESQRHNDMEIVTVVFHDKKHGIKKLDAEFANMTILD